MDTALQLWVVLVTSLLLGISGYRILPQVQRSSGDLSAGDILCRSCDDVRWPELCKITQTCGNNQTCFTQEYRDRYGRRAYRLGCQPRQMCPHYSQGSITGRKRQNKAQFCHQCCDKMDCNWRLCHAFGWPTTFLIPSPTTPTFGFLSCNFDWDTCAWRQPSSNDFNWMRRLGATTSGAGPDTDYTAKLGYYLYINASAPQREGDKAQLQAYSAHYLQSGGFEQCLKFDYSMTGADVGTLEVSINPNTVLWSKSGYHGPGWSSASVPLPRGGIKVIITAVVGKGGSGVIAIDDIRSTFGKC